MANAINRAIAPGIMPGAAGQIEVKIKQKKKKKKKKKEKKEKAEERSPD